MKKMHTLAAVLLAAGVLATATVSAQEKKWTTVTIATEGAFRPFNFTKPDGTLDGYEIDYYKVLCEKMKVECKLVVVPFSSLIPSLTSGKVDAVMSGLSATPKREETIAFSVPYSVAGNVFATLKSSPLAKFPGDGGVLSLDRNEAEVQKYIDTIKPQLQGKIMGVQTASIASTFIQKYLSGVVTVREYKTPEECDLDLLAGRVDITLVSPTYMVGAMKKPANAELTTTGPRLTGGLLGRGSSVGLRKTDPELKALFDRAIHETVAEGTNKALSLKWVGIDTTPVE